MNDAAPGSMLEPEAVVELKTAEADAAVALAALKSVAMAVKVGSHCLYFCVVIDTSLCVVAPGY
jgi:hypothetical protein